MFHVEWALDKVSFNVPLHGYNVTCDVLVAEENVDRQTDRKD